MTVKPAAMPIMATNMRFLLPGAVKASRNGFFFVLDRITGERLVSRPFIEINWASGVDAKGHPVRKTDLDPRPDGALVEPSSGGSTNWLAPSFDPLTRLFYVSARRVFSIFYLTATGKAEGWGGRDRDLWSSGALRALDYRTGQPVWDHALGDGEGSAGILTTAGNLLFTADASGNLLALDPSNGRTLWHLYAGGNMENGPTTYELDGRQYVLMAVEDSLYAFALPPSAGSAAESH